MAVRKIWNRIVPALLLCMLLSACGNGGGKTGFNVTPPDSNSPESSLNVESAAPETKALEEPSSSVPASRPPSVLGRKMEEMELLFASSAYQRSHVFKCRRRKKRVVLRKGVSE